jgi:hypothetical protein
MTARRFPWAILIIGARRLQRGLMPGGQVRAFVNAPAARPLAPSKKRRWRRCPPRVDQRRGIELSAERPTLWIDHSLICTL